MLCMTAVIVHDPGNTLTPSLALCILTRFAEVTTLLLRHLKLSDIQCLLTPDLPFLKDT